MLDGTHTHAQRQEDVRLEAGQVIYWAIIVALQVGVDWNQLRADIALQSRSIDMPLQQLISLLRNDAARLAADTPLDDSQLVGSTLHATLALVSQACWTERIGVEAILDEDLRLLRQKRYLRAFWSSSTN